MYASAKPGSTCRFLVDTAGLFWIEWREKLTMDFRHSFLQKIGTSHPQEAPLTDDEAATKIQGRFRTQQQRSEYKKSNNRGRQYR
jgi:hypothetical protein